MAKKNKSGNKGTTKGTVAEETPKETTAPATTPEAAPVKEEKAPELVAKYPEGTVWEVDLVRKGKGVVEVDINGLNDLMKEHGPLVNACIKGSEGEWKPAMAFFVALGKTKSGKKKEKGQKTDKGYTPTSKNAAANTLAELIGLKKEDGTPLLKGFDGKSKAFNVKLGDKTGAAYSRSKRGAIANFAKFSGASAEMASVEELKALGVTIDEKKAAASAASAAKADEAEGDEGGDEDEA